MSDFDYIMLGYTEDSGYEQTLKMRSWNEDLAFMLYFDIRGHGDAGDTGYLLGVEAGVSGLFLLSQSFLSRLCYAKRLSSSPLVWHLHQIFMCFRNVSLYVTCL